MPVRGDAVKRTVAASAVAAIHHRIPAAQTPTNLRQPGAVGRFVVVIRIDRIIDLLAGQAAGVDHFAVSRLEIDAMNEITVDRSALGEIRRTAEKPHLSAASLDRQGATDSE